MKFSPNVDSFQKKNEGQIRNQCRHIYSSAHVYRDITTFSKVNGPFKKLNKKVSLVLQKTPRWKVSFIAGK